MLALQKLHRSCAKRLMFFMNPYNFFVEQNEFLIFFSPWVSPAVIRIGKSAHAGFVSIIQRRRSRPCHLDHDSFPKNAFVDSFRRRLRAQRIDTPRPVVRTRQKTGVIMIGQLIHRAIQRRRQKTRHIMIHRTFKIIDITERTLLKTVAVLFHPG